MSGLTLRRRQGGQMLRRVCETSGLITALGLGVFASNAPAQEYSELRGRAGEKGVPATSPLPSGESDTRVSTLKDVAGEMVISVATSWEGDRGIIKGPNVEQVRQTILKHFNGIQPAVYPAWGGFWPTQKPAAVEDSTFWVEPLSAQVEWAKARDLHVMHHVLLAPNYYFPDWWRETHYTAPELEIILKKYIRTAVSVKGVDAWNVANELFLGDGSYFNRGSGEWDIKWLDMGMEPDASGLTGEEKVNDEHPRFVRIALEHAAAHTDGKLEIRGGTTFRDPRKLDALYQLALHLRNLGTPLHAVGIQGHLDYNGDYDFEAFKENVAKFRKAGLEFYITELDVGLPEGEDPESVDWKTVEALQAGMYFHLVQAAREAGVSLISVWGLTDEAGSGWRGGQRALLFDNHFAPKATYDAFQKGLGEAK